MVDLGVLSILQNYFIFKDETGLVADLGFLAHLPELCDVTFMVGTEKVKKYYIWNLYPSKLFLTCSLRGDTHKTP